MKKNIVVLLLIIASILLGACAPKPKVGDYIEVINDSVGVHGTNDLLQNRSCSLYQGERVKVIRTNVVDISGSGVFMLEVEIGSNMMCPDSGFVPEGFKNFKVVE